MSRERERPTRDLPDDAFTNEGELHLVVTTGGISSLLLTVLPNGPEQPSWAVSFWSFRSGSRFATGLHPASPD